MRPTKSRTWFTRLTKWTAHISGRPATFILAAVIIVVWALLGRHFGFSDTWQLVINTATSVLAFLLIALLQNSERRYDEALHHKIDALAVGLADLMQYQGQADPELLERHIKELRAAVGLEREI